MSSSAEQLDLIVYELHRSPRRFTLTDDRVTIGRGSSCTVGIQDPFLSRQHAEILLVGGEWHLSDNGSVNGTYLNGTRLEAPRAIHSGDRITFGDIEIRIEKTGSADPAVSLTIGDHNSVASLSVSMADITAAGKTSDRTSERLEILNRLAMELLEDRPMNELFDFIVDRVMSLLTPSRVALGILDPDGNGFADVKVRRAKSDDNTEIAISQTLIQDVVRHRKVLSFTDVSQQENLKQARSIIAQDIRSALCAPLVVEDSVMGLLYFDYLITQRSITEDDVRLAGKIAQIAARKLETTHLREKAVEKQKLDDEMQTAFVIQSRLLPADPPTARGYKFEGHYRPCRTVSGDYFDFVERPDGRVYFIIADVSGKGLTAALVMAGVAAAFNTLTNFDPAPAKLLSDLNRMLARKTDDSMFVTAFCGVAEPDTGRISFCNAGHNPPYVVVDSGEARQVAVQPGLVLGFIPDFEFVADELTLDEGSTLYLYTDGITEATNVDDEEFGNDRLLAVLTGSAGRTARDIAIASLEAVDEFAVGASQADDMTLLCVKRTNSSETSGDQTKLRA